MQTPSAIDYVLNDHSRIRGLFRQLEVIDERAPEMKRGVMDELCAELEIHCQVIDSAFLPLLRNALDVSGAGQVEASLDAHRQWLRTINRLRRIRIEDHRFDDALSDFISDVETNFDEIEMKLLHQAKTALPVAELDDLGRTMTETREDLFRSEKYRSARPERRIA